MKTYKHKTLGWSAEIDGLRGRVKNDVDVYFEGLTFQSNYAIQIPTILIENSSDREEVVEKDWIQLAREEYQEYDLQTLEKAFRKAIEKHAPKTKKFTYEDIEIFLGKPIYPDKERLVMKNHISLFLKKHNLLSDTH